MVQTLNQVSIFDNWYVHRINVWDNSHNDSVYNLCVIRRFLTLSFSFTTWVLFQSFSEIIFLISDIGEEQPGRAHHIFWWSYVLLTRWFYWDYELSSSRWDMIECIVGLITFQRILHIPSERDGTWNFGSNQLVGKSDIIYNVPGCKSEMKKRV